MVCFTKLQILQQKFLQQFLFHKDYRSTHAIIRYIEGSHILDLLEHIPYIFWCAILRYGLGVDIWIHLFDNLSGILDHLSHNEICYHS